MSECERRTAARVRPVVDRRRGRGPDVLALVACRHVTVVRADGTHRRAVSGPGACIGFVQASAGPLVADGARAAWLTTGGGNTLEGEVRTVAPVRGGRVRSADFTEETDIGGGSHLSGLAGGVGLIAWAVTNDVRTEPNDDCDFGCPIGFRTVVRRLDGRVTRDVAVIDDDARLLAAAGRRLVVRVGGEVQVLAPTGALVASVVSDAVAAAVLRPRAAPAPRSHRVFGPGRQRGRGAADRRARAGRRDAGGQGALRGVHRHRSHPRRAAGRRRRPGDRHGAGRSGAGGRPGGRRPRLRGVVYGRNSGCRAEGACRGEVHLVPSAAIARALGPVRPT